MVDDLPHNLDGLKLYKIKCSPQEWVKKRQDLRYLNMHSLRRKDLKGTRKVGRCIRNLYCSYDDSHLSFLQKEKRTECGWTQDLLQLWKNSQETVGWGM